MGVVIQCNNKIIHSSYTEFEFFKNELLKACIYYVNNKITQNSNYNSENIKNTLYGIKLFIYNNHFCVNDSIIFLKSILCINKFINITQNMYMLFCMFLYSVKTNSDLFIK